ncbi:unnamed protein product [marine sediment metagenome]|uniref:Uncharacterized protein n=1 Tax=marine sediment metagenome TaxID=412755 RepID=X1ELU1_9ZZZZ
MKHERKDYNRFQDPQGLIPEDEPVFLLRGQDVLAPDLLMLWAQRLRNRGGSSYMAVVVEKHAEKMVAWQENIKQKLPDLP